MSVPVAEGAVLLEARGLRKVFAARKRGAAAHVAVDDVDLTVRRGEVIGLVGESGSGKTTLGKLLLRVLSPDAGSVRFDGVELTALDRRAMRPWRSRMQMVYQSASASLNPGFTVREHLLETVRLHRPERGPEAADLVSQTMARYGIEHRGDARPGALSGGERRRVALARCLLPEPELVVADEPTAGLDASVKGTILDLMLGADATPRSWVFISHELDVVRYVADRVFVMVAGRLVEELPPASLDPRAPPDVRHPYTERLLASAFHSALPVLPDLEPSRVSTGSSTGGSTGGCAYRNRCHQVAPGGPMWNKCTEDRPDRVPLGRGRSIACHAVQARATETEGAPRPLQET